MASRHLLHGDARRPTRRAFAAWLVAALLAPAALPAFAGCQFSTAGIPLAIGFGALDPSRPAAKGAVHALALSGDCANLSQGGIQLVGGSQRVMRSASGAELAYLATLREVAASSSGGRLQLELTVPAGSYANLPAGDYADTLILSLLP